ncbi:MAG: hypothetical protein Q8N69_02630 [bacterium]|nr:hypothetical protein [bacterium]
MPENQGNKNLLSDEEIRKLVIARLKVLSPETIISLGSAGSFSRDELVKKVEEGDKIGEKLAEIEMEWLQSLKEGKLYEDYRNSAEL